MKKRRKARQAPPPAAYPVGTELIHRKEKRRRVRIKMIAGAYFVVFGFHNGRNWTISFDQLEKHYRLQHIAVLAKVGTGPLKRVTLEQSKLPRVGDQVRFNEILNGDFKGGLVDGTGESKGETFYEIERM